MERDEILQSLQELKRQLPIDGLDQTTIEEQAKRFDDARRVSEQAESRIAYLEEKLKKDENYVTDKMAFYARTVEENREEVADMISRSDRLAAELIRDDRRLATARKQRVEAEAFGDAELLARMDSNIARLEGITNRKSEELDVLNSNIEELETLINNQENQLESEGIIEEIENLKAKDRAEIEHLNMEVKSASTEAMLSQYNFVTSLNDLITDVEKGNISEEVVKEKLVEYKERLPKQFLLRDAAARTEEKLQLEEALAKYEPRLAELEEKLSNEDNYRGVYADSLVAVREAGQADLDRYTDEIKQNGSRIAEINNEMRRFEAINKESQRIIDQRKNEIAALPNQRHPMKKHLEAEISRREQEIERNVTAMHSLRSEKGMLSSNIDRLRELTKPLKVEIEKINKEIAEDAKKINKSQQRLDKIERDDLVRGIESSKQRLAHIEYDVSETIDNIVGNLDKSIAKKAKNEKETVKEVEEENKDKKATPIILGTGAAALNGVVKEDEDGKNFIVVFGPNGEELLNVEIPKNVVIPEKKEEDEVVVAPIVEEKEENEKAAPVAILGFEPASEELKEEVKKKGIIAKLKGQCTRFKEKSAEVKDWFKKNKKRIAAGVVGTVAVVGLLTMLKSCDGEKNINNDVPPIENVIESGDIEMPTFEFETSGDVAPELTEAEKIAIAWDVIRGDYGNTPERRENLENAGYNADEIQDIVNELLKDMNKNTPTPVEPEPEVDEPVVEDSEIENSVVDEPVDPEPGSGDNDTEVKDEDNKDKDGDNKGNNSNSKPSRPSRPSKPSKPSGGGSVPEDPKPVDPEPVVPTPSDDIVVDVLPGETYITPDGNFVQNTGNGVNSEIGGDIIDVIEQNGGSVGAVVSGSENDKALSNGNMSLPSTGLAEDDVLNFYKEMGIQYENPTQQKNESNVVTDRVEADVEDELIKEEFVPVTPNTVAEEAVTNPTGANGNTVVGTTTTPTVVEETKVVDEVVKTPAVVEENKVVEETAKTPAKVEETKEEETKVTETKVENETVKEESLKSTGLADDDVLSFYKQLGITPPSVDENTMSGKTR